MGERFLIDTNILIGYIGRIMPEKAMAYVSEVIDEEFNISVINKIEVLGHNTAGDKIEDFISLANVYDPEQAVVNKTIRLCKRYKTKLPDAIIAATAIVNDFTIMTRNTKDFDKIEGL